MRARSQILRQCRQPFSSHPRHQTLSASQHALRLRESAPDANPRGSPGFPIRGDAQFRSNRLLSRTTATECPQPNQKSELVFRSLLHLPQFPLPAVRWRWPLTVDRSVWEARLYLPQAENAAQWFSREYTRCVTRDVWLEDGSTLENVQRGLASGALSHTPLQDQELLIRHANKLAEDFIEDGER